MAREVVRMKRERGMTLVELVVVLSLLGVLAAVGAQLMVSPAVNFINGSDRADLTAMAERALRRMSAEIRASLPNSLRLSTVSGVAWVEFLPVSDAGRLRLRVAPGSPDTGDPLDVSNSLDSAFDVFGPLPTLYSDSQLVTYNLGTTDGDAWSGNNRRAGLSLDTAGGRILFTPNGAFPTEPPSGRFMLVRGPVSFSCAGSTDASGNGTGTLTRYDNYTLSATQPTNAAASPLSSARAVTLASGVSNCSITYDTEQSNLGVMTISVKLAQGNTTMPLDWEVLVDNTP
jgi:MSHA biogenesis protein MshO